MTNKQNIVDECIDELLLNLIADHPRITSCWVARALDIPVGRANRRLSKWRKAGVISSYQAGAYTNYERIYYFPDDMPDFFARPEHEADTGGGRLHTKRPQVVGGE